MALERAPSRQLTLAEIYDWIVGNIPYFYDKGDANSSIGWKNSIRHNLSLHEKFSRVPHNGATQNAKVGLNVTLFYTKLKLLISSNMTPGGSCDGGVILFFRTIKSRIILICNITRRGSYYSKNGAWKSRFPYNPGGDTLGKILINVR